MDTIAKIAWRNISRNRHRSAITVAAVAIGLSALIFLKGFIDGADRQMVDNYTDLLIGRIQVHHAGFQKHMDLNKSIAQTTHLKELLRDIPGVAAAAGRVKNFALISSTENSQAVLLLGVDPRQEKKVSTLHRRLFQGRFLQENNDNQIVIGRSLAEQLRVSLNDKVVIMGQGSDGSMAAAAYEVTGLMETGAEEIDKNLALISLKAAQDLFVLKEKISEIVIQTHSPRQTDAVAQDIQSRLDGKKYETLTWKQISPMTYQWLQFDMVFTALILFIVLLVVAASILNTILMGVLERRREFGVLLALGTKPSQIIRMVALESFFLGLLGVTLGGSAGAALVIATGRTGIDLSAFSSALNSFYIGSVIHPVLDMPGLLITAAIVLVISATVALFPAAGASRLVPIEAIKAN